jgi:hypothetical protein
MIDRYDPLETPDPQEGLDLDEGERLRPVEDFHRRARVRLPNAKVHAVMHAIIENQIALGDEIPVNAPHSGLWTKGLIGMTPFMP